MTNGQFKEVLRPWVCSSLGTENNRKGVKRQGKKGKGKREKGEGKNGFLMPPSQATGLNKTGFLLFAGMTTGRRRGGDG